MLPDYVRPAVAAVHFGVSRRTLARWTASGLVGKSRVGRCTWLRAADIASLIARNEARRTVVPIAASAARTATDDAYTYFASGARR